MIANMILSDKERENARENGGFLPIMREDSSSGTDLYVINRVDSIEFYTRLRVHGENMSYFYVYLITKYRDNDETLDYMSLLKEHPIKRIRF